MSEMPKVGSVWRHKKDESIWTVLDTSPKGVSLISPQGECVLISLTVLARRFVEVRDACRTQTE